ncbi:MAG: hypothetical protein SNJ74_08795 [Fimbriimonadaceae bacterium]
MSEALLWKPDWDAARARLEDWWEGRGCALSVTAPLDEPRPDRPDPVPAPDLRTGWIDPEIRFVNAVAEMAATYYGGVAFPYVDTQIGPGSLGLVLGQEPEFGPDTVWYPPVIQDPDSHPPLRYDPEDRWLKVHLALIERGLAGAEGRFLVGIPDLIENIDTLAQLRGPETLMEDLLDRPDWVERQIWDINEVFFQVFGRMFELVRDVWGGNAFSAFKIWGPGKTAKVQCDAGAMISEEMFRRFVQPALAVQCEWLDFSMFHLDGTQALHHLDALLEIEHLDAIEWTPQAGIEGGGSPRWYDLYRRIRAGGKSVQAILVEPHEVLPLIDAVGPEGLFVMCRAGSEAEARKLERAVYGD